MKSVSLALASAFVLALSFSSCKKCSVCTYEDDSETRVDSTVCGKGKLYKDQLYQYEKAGWTCVDE